MPGRGWVHFVALGGLVAALSIGAAEADASRYLRCPPGYEVSAQRCEWIAKHRPRPNPPARETAQDHEQQPKHTNESAAAVESQDKAASRERERQEANQREKDNLTAQEALVRASWWQVGIAGGGVLGLIISLFLTIKALALANREVKSSEDTAARQAADTVAALAISKRAADAASEANKLSRDIFLASERPWVKANIRLAGDLLFDKSGDVAIPLTFELENVGKSPAKSVWIELEAFILGIDENRPQERLINFAAVARNKKQGHIGHTLFPHDPIPQGIVTSIPKASVDKARAQGGWMSPMIIGCVNYQFVFEGGVHQTGFILDVTWVRPEHPGQVFAIPLAAEIPTGQARLFHGLFSAHAD